MLLDGIYVLTKDSGTVLLKQATLAHRILSLVLLLVFCPLFFYRAFLISWDGITVFFGLFFIMSVIGNWYWFFQDRTLSLEDDGATFTLSGKNWGKQRNKRYSAKGNIAVKAMQSTDGPSPSHRVLEARLDDGLVFSLAESSSGTRHTERLVALAEKMEKLTHGKLRLEPNHYSHPSKEKSIWLKDLFRNSKN